MSVNGSSYASGFPFVQSEGLAGPGAAPASAPTVDDHKVIASSAPPDLFPGALIDKMVAGSGIVLSNVLIGPNNRAVLVATNGAIPAKTAYAQELYSYDLCSTESAITRSGIPGTDSSGTRGFALVVQQTFTAAYLTVTIRNRGGNWMRLGIYDANGNLVSKTDRFSPIANTLMKVPLVDAVTLSGQMIYYLAYWTDDTTGNLQFNVIEGRSISTRSPLMQRSDVNEMPFNIASAITNTALRPWLAAASN